MALNTATKSPITGALGGQDLDVTSRALQATLVDMIDLHLVAKQVHWNVVGKNFRDVHLHLDELVNEARGYADDVAERCAALGVPPDGRASTVAERSSVLRFEPGWRMDRDVSEAITAALEGVIHRLRERVQETDRTDLITQDLLIGITRELEKTHWMWQAKLAS